MNPFLLPFAFVGAAPRRDSAPCRSAGENRRDERPEGSELGGEAVARGGAAPTVVLLIGLCLLAAPALGAEDAIELEDLVVTAGLEPVAAADVAGSLTVITREEIERRQVNYLSELLRSVPGFAVSQAGGPGGFTQVRVRGAEANQLLVLIDGIRANDPASGDEFQFQYALTSDIERIEIIRGPQSATWGTDALAGVINIIRRNDIAPGASYLNSDVEGGSFGSLTAGVDGGLQRGAVRLSAGVSYLESDGTNISRGPGEDDGTDNTTADARLEIEASDTLRLTFTGQHVDAHSDFDGISFVTGLPTDGDQFTEADQSYLSGTAMVDPVGGRWDGTASVHWFESDNQNYAFGAWDGSTAAETLELRLRASLGLSADEPLDHRLTFAIDHRDVDFSQRGIASAFGDPNQDQSYEVAGYAVEYLGRPAEGLTWTASARRDEFSDFDDATTWQLAAARRFEQGWRLRGSLGTGSKAPTFIERYGFFPDLFLGNPNLEPETSRGWELGADVAIGASGFTFSATWFDQQLEDEIDGFVFDPDTFLFTAVNRPGESERKGLELVVAGALTSGLSLNASYTYTDATEFSSAGDIGPEIRRPEHMASLVLNQAFAEGRGNVNLDVSYNGTQLDNYFPPPEFARVQVELDDYTLVDLAASWALTPSLELTARISNLLDEDYEEILGFARPGRAVFAGLRGRFSR